MSRRHNYPSFSVTCPEWARSGDTLELEVGSTRSRFLISVPSEVRPGDVFSVTLGIGATDGDAVVRVLPREESSPADLVPSTKRPRSFAVRALYFCFPTLYAALVWLLVAVNYVRIVILRVEPWTPAIYASQVVLAFQVAAYTCTMITPPGSVPPNWHLDAALRGAGRVYFVIDSRTGQRLPLRSRYLFRHGAAVLGFDHVCHIFGRPIGLRNRKAFVLFLCYSSLLTGIALGLVTHALVTVAVSAVRTPPTPAGLFDFLRWAPRARLEFVRAVFSLTYAAIAHEEVVSFVSNLVVAVADVAAVVGLTAFSLYHVQLVLQNRTSMSTEDESRFDVGAAANWRQVFGERRALWLLPIAWDGPTVDGIHWPENPNFVEPADEEGGAAQHRPSSDASEEVLQGGEVRTAAARIMTAGSPVAPNLKAE